MRLEGVADVGGEHRADLAERRVEAAEHVDQARGLGVLARVDAAARERLDLLDLHLAPLRDDANERPVHGLELAHQRGALVLRERRARREQPRSRSALHRLGGDPELLHQRLEREPRADHADRARDGHRLADDLVRGRRDVISAARGDVRHARDHGLLAGELHDLVMHAIGRQGASAR